MLYDQLLTNVNGIEGKISNTNWLINKSQYETDKENLLKKGLKTLTKKYLILLVYSKILIVI